VKWIIEKQMRKKDRAPEDISQFKNRLQKVKQTLEAIKQWIAGHIAIQTCQKNWTKHSKARISFNSFVLLNC
jgi:hypothetical protein